MDIQKKPQEQRYVLGDVVDLIWNKGSDDLKSKISLNELDSIVHSLIHFYDKTGLIDHGDESSLNDNPLSISDSIDDDIIQYLMQESKKNNINLSEKNILEILDREYEYLIKIGAIEEDMI